MATLCCCLELTLGIFAGCAPAIKPLAIALLTKIESGFYSNKPEPVVNEQSPTQRSTVYGDFDALTNVTFDTIDLENVRSPSDHLSKIRSTGSRTAASTSLQV